MSDAVVLLAISQLVCLGGLVYLYREVMQLRSARPRERHTSTRVRPLAPGGVPAVPEPRIVTRTPAATPEPDLAGVARRMTELGVDIPALARRMQRSEEEIRLLLRRQGAA